MEKNKIKLMISLIAFLIAIIVIYHFNQNKEIEGWSNSALLSHKEFIYDQGPYQCNCQCQLKCPEKSSTTTTTTQPPLEKKTKNKLGYRISYYPWYVQTSHD